MTQKIVLITGTGRSGTSFVANAFQEAGLPPGGSFSPKVRAGYEFAPLTEVNANIIKQLPFPECRESVGLLSEFQQSMAEVLKGKHVVKDPRFCTTLDAWVHAGLVERVIMMQRLPSESLASSDTVGTMEPTSPEMKDRYRWWWAQIGYAAWVCDMHDIPRTVIRFPQVAQDEGEDFFRLVNEITLHGVDRAAATAAIRKSRNLDYIQHSPPR